MKKKIHIYSYFYFKDWDKGDVQMHLGITEYTEHLKGFLSDRPTIGHLSSGSKVAASEEKNNVSIHTEKVQDVSYWYGLFVMFLLGNMCGLLKLQLKWVSGCETTKEVNKEL